MARYVLPGSWPGLLVHGNIDIDFRSTLHVPNPQGGFSSVDSVSFSVSRHGDEFARFVPFRKIPTRYQHVEVLVPQVVRSGGGWRVVGPLQAWRTFTHTRRFLGIFDNPAHANKYAVALHIEQAKVGARR